MTVAPPPEFTTDGGALVELDEENEAEELGSRNYRFIKIGEPVPLKSDGASEFEPQSPPSQALAVSERFRLLFVAHPEGFYVARTKDVMASAEEIKEKRTGSSIQELSLVDVPIGKVSILVLSADDSLLAASVSSHVHFFAVSALLHKEQKPSYSVSPDESICIKDVRWSKRVAKSYLILASNGKLYHGSGQGSLINVMESVDSVDWSIKDNFIAVAKKKVVSILSSQFKEKIRFLLSFQSVIGDSDANQVIRVDSVRWIRPDSIAVGLFLLNDDGEEENYVVQVITSRGRRITDEASKPIVLSFNNVFMDFCSDTVPPRNGPHLFLNYLDLYGLAFVASRNLSSQVALFSWQESGNSEAAMVEILDDAWTLYIDSQGNGDENVIVGLSVDKVSQNQNVTFPVGNEERTVSPCCVIICETIDGKVSVFHFASTAGALPSPESYDSGEEDDASQETVKPVLSQISSAGAEESGEPTFSTSQSYDLSRIVVAKASGKATSAIDPSRSLNVDIRSLEKDAPESMGQKPLVNSETLKMDNPEKALSVVLNQDNNAEDQSTSELKHGKGFSSGKITGDVSRQSVSNYPLLGSNAEPLHKVSPPATSPSAWSFTMSNAKVDAIASTTSDGRLLTLPSNEVAKSDKHTFRSAGGVPQHPTELKEKPSVSFTSPGHTGLATPGNRISQTAYVGSHVPGGNNVASAKSFQSDFKKESNAASYPASVTHFSQNASKQFGNVEDMAKKLDILLEGIERKGGFRDASITSQTDSVRELEEGIWALSDRCKMQRGVMNEQQGELQLLLDKTVEVLVRKVYMEGIFKQATDSKYWEIWNRQKLSSELELKRRRILELNQDLTNKLIELERHFNSLEFNKFRESEGIQKNQRALQNWHGHSRQIQSIRSLHNTTTAQLAAAEHLSGCLSKQMAALKIESSGKHDVKRQLFESIGLAYDGETEISPARKRTSDTPANKEYLTASGFIAAKGRSRRNQASFAKGCESETARQRRDSFDRSWASFDPPKTTLKRMLKEDTEKGSSSRSFLKISKQYLSPQSQRKSGVAHTARLNTSGASLNHYKSKGFAEASAEQFTEGPSTSLYHRTAEFQDRVVQMSSEKSFPALPPPSLLETRTAQNSEVGAFRLPDKSKSSLISTGNNQFFATSGSKLGQQSNTSFHPLPSMSAQVPEQSLTSTSDSTENSDSFKIGFTKSTSWDQKNTKIGSQTPISAFSSGPNVSEKGLFNKNSENTSRPNDSLSASSPWQSVPGSSLLSLNNYPSPALESKSNSSTLFPANLKSSESSAVTKQEGTQSQPTVTSSVNFPSTLPFLTHGSSSSSVSSPSSIVKSESLTSASLPAGVIYGSKPEAISEMQTKVDNMPSKTETGVEIETSNSQPDLPTSTSSLQFGPSALPTLTELSTHSKSVSQDDIGDSSKNSSAVTSDIKPEMPYAPEVLPTAAVSSGGINGSINSVVLNPSHEEEMEEEAPETNQATEFGFANLVGFGIGSAQNSTTPKSNPFGVGVLNKNTTFSTSPFTMSASSGELFPPASFNFQSLQPIQSLQPTTVNSSSGFSSGVPGQVSGAAGFGRPAQIGAGQQALGSVLGTFGQSRQFGTGLPGNSAASASGFSGGFTGISSGGFGGGFATAASGGGFAGLAAGGGGGGFASAATGGGGFAAAATAGGGFAAAAPAGGGFAAAAPAGGGFAAAAISGGSGFGAFSNQPGSGGFPAFGSGSVAGRPPSELFTQMRK